MCNCKHNGYHDIVFPISNTEFTVWIDFLLCVDFIAGEHLQWTNKILCVVQFKFYHVLLCIQLSLLIPLGTCGSDFISLIWKYSPVFLYQYEDDEAAEEFKIQSFVAMMLGVKKVGIPHNILGRPLSLP